MNPIASRLASSGQNTNDQKIDKKKIKTKHTNLKNRI